MLRRFYRDFGGDARNAGDLRVTVSFSKSRWQVTYREFKTVNRDVNGGKIFQDHFGRIPVFYLHAIGNALFRT
jgi:hypothetical protein